MSSNPPEMPEAPEPLEADGEAAPTDHAPAIEEAQW